MPSPSPASSASRFHSGMLYLIGQSNSVVAENHLTPPKDASGLAVKVYSPKDPIDIASLQSFGSPEALGGKVLSGKPELFGRFDYFNGNVASGLFMATTGAVEITFPFTEYATLLDGEITLTDSNGVQRIMKPGDSYFILQGQVVRLETKRKQFIKSFFNIVNPAP